MSSIKYVAPDGKVYIRTGVDEDQLPSFAYNDQGDINYRYDRIQPVEEYEFLVDDETGDLTTDATGVFITEDGYINSQYTWTLVTDEGATSEIQGWIDQIRAHNKKVMMKVTLLNDNYAEIENLTGRVIGAPTYEYDSESDIRKTCTLTLSVPIKEQIEIDFENTWNRRMVELSCGLYNWSTQTYTWFNLGRMLMTSGSTVYDAVTQEIRLNLVDLMASMTQERGSQMGTTLKFPAGVSVRDSLIAIVTSYSPFKLYNVAVFPDTMPYDIVTDIGDYPIEAIKMIINLFPTYEYFYDNDGYFTVREIPTKIGDPIDFHKEMLDDLLISESRETNFTDIHNTTEIWGRQLSSDYTAISCTTVGGSKYEVTIDPSFDTLVDGETYTIYPLTDSVAGQTMQIQSTTEYALYTSDGAGTTYTPLAAGAMKADTAYSIRYFEEKFVLQGELNVHCIVMEITEEPTEAMKTSYKTANACDNVEWIVNPTSSYACTIQNGFILGEKKQVFEGGEYDAIYTTSLAFERAKYENWKSCRLQDTITVEMILVPWMEVNDKIEFTSPSSGSVGVWLVKSISYDFERWTMTVVANRFYPVYPWD